MAKNKNKIGNRMEEWLTKLIKGVAGGLILSVIMLLTGEFKGDGVGMIVLCFLGFMFYGIGFSFGSIIIKLSWRKFVARGKNIGIWAAITGGGYVTFILALVILLAGLVVGWIGGCVLCVADIICAVQGRRLLSSIIEARYGYRQYESADPGDVIDAGVRYNYEDHGTAFADKTDTSRGYTPTEEQVRKGVQQHRNKF